MIIVRVVEQTITIVAFVFVMMLVVEYFNVVTQGVWLSHVRARGWRQHVLASLLGATPGCLGAFTSVVLYEHGIIAMGAVAAAMIATSGDAIFVMVAMIPRQAVVITVILFVLGIIVGLVLDWIGGHKLIRLEPTCKRLELHEQEMFGWIPGKGLLAEWRQCSLQRGVLVVGLVLFIFAVATRWVGAETELWLRTTLLLVSVLGLFIVATVPEHFLEEHLWNHVARRHLPAVFLWTLAGLFFVELIKAYTPAEQWTPGNMLIVLTVACLVGIIPDSGPHLVFVIMYASGKIPFSVLLANSIVQDGHGMLPLLACSRRDFVKVKLINFIAGIVVGFALYAVGF